MIYLRGKIMDQDGVEIANAVVFPGVLNGAEFVPSPNLIRPLTNII